MTPSNASAPFLHGPIFTASETSNIWCDRPSYRVESRWHLGPRVAINFSPRVPKNCLDRVLLLNRDLTPEETGRWMRLMLLASNLESKVDQNRFLTIQPRAVNGRRPRILMCSNSCRESLVKMALACHLDSSVMDLANLQQVPHFVPKVSVSSECAESRRNHTARCLQGSP